MNIEEVILGLGRLEGRIMVLEASKLERDISFKDIGESIKQVNITVNNIEKTIALAKGGWKTLLLISGASGALGAIFFKLSQLVGALPR